MSQSKNPGGGNVVAFSRSPSIGGGRLSESTSASKLVDRDVFAKFLRDEAARIERGPIHLRAVRAGVNMHDWQRHETRLLEMSMGLPVPDPHSGKYDAFHCARAIQFFSDLKARHMAAVSP